jgi:hypothetical protein
MEITFSPENQYLTSILNGESADSICEVLDSIFADALAEADRCANENRHAFICLVGVKALVKETFNSIRREAEPEPIRMFSDND